MRRVVVPGGEPELAALLDLFPAGVEELHEGFAVYTDAAGERALRDRFPAASASDVAEGWDDAWRAFHHGVVVGRLWVGPPWEAPPPAVEAVVIDPGRAFGTGAHPTTRLCLELLQEVRPTSILDVGCGSGVLSIAAARLGFAPVVAVDVDPAAVDATLANARTNGLEVPAHRADALADELPETAVVVANIALEAVESLLARVEAPCIITSGYLERDIPAAAGRRRVARRTAGGWAADLLCSQGSVPGGPSSSIPCRERYLRLVHRLGRLTLDAHERWLDEVERELS